MGNQVSRQNSRLKTRKAYSIWLHRNTDNKPASRTISEETPTWENTIPFVPPVSGGLVIKVYDGDTITIATHIYDDPTMYRFSVRLFGINAPEIRTRDTEEKELAQMAQKVLSDLLLGKYVTLKNVTVEKYGRLLAEVYLGDQNMNQYMLDNKLVEHYEC